MKKKYADTVTLKKVGYKIRGTSHVSHWSGGEGSIEMTPFSVKTLNRRVIVKNINDAQFGVKGINSADLNIFTLYENGYEVPLKYEEIKIRPSEKKLVQTGIKWLGRENEVKKVSKKKLRSIS